MPGSIGGESRNRLEDLLAELIDKFDEHLTAPPPPPPPPTVNVDAPTINVEAKAPAPVVNVAAPPPSTPRPWLLTVSRDTDGKIATITINPK